MHLVSRVLDIPEDWVHEYNEREMDALHHSEKQYRKKELSNVRNRIEDMKREVPKHERREMRRRYLSEEIRRVKKLYLEKQAPELKKKLSRLVFEAQLHTGKQTGMTQESIERARQVPFSKIIETRNGIAECPFHNDKTPSMDTRNNFYYCYGCGANGDIIDFVMKVKDTSFQGAVEMLSVLS